MKYFCKADIPLPGLVEYTTDLPSIVMDNRMTILTLTTDWGWGGYALAALKGRMLGLLPQAAVVDVSHEVPNHEGLEAAFVLRHAYPHFPADTIHYIGVAATPTVQQPLVLVRAHNQFFLWKDHGLFGLLFTRYDQAVALPYTATDQVIDFLPPLVHALHSGAPLSSLGTPRPITLALPQAPLQQQHALVGAIVHIDKFGNVITNISQAVYEAMAQGRKCTILLNSQRYKIEQLSQHYSDVSEGHLVAFFNAIGLLEIGVNQGNAHQLYRLQKGRSTITVHFEQSDTTPPPLLLFTT